MDENRIEGTTRNFGGKVQEGIGRVTGDAKTRAEGVLNQATGAAQDLYGQGVLMGLAKLQRRWMHFCEKPSRPSPIRLRSSR